MKHPLGIRVDSPWRVWLLTSLAPMLTAAVALAATYIFFGQSSFQSFSTVHGVVALIPLATVGAVVYCLSQIAYIHTKRAETLLHLAQTDDLTQLYNRRTFFEQGHNLITDANMHGETLGLLLLDADNFKSVNDTFGHLAGDEALRYLASCICHCSKEGDLVARFGGDEFVVLRRHSSYAQMVQLAATIQAYIVDHPFHYRNHEFPLSMSMGVADTERVQTFDELLSATDVALYKRKTNTQTAETNGHGVFPPFSHTPLAPSFPHTESISEG